MRIIGIKILLLSLLLVLVSGCQSKNTFTDLIISQIDNKCEVNQACNISIKGITNFEWDRVVLFEVGSSRKEISTALGIEYTKSTDLMSGIVFALDNKIVYEERVSYDPEKRSKLEISIEKESNDVTYVKYDIDNAVVRGEKKETEGTLYYSINAY